MHFVMKKYYCKNQYKTNYFYFSINTLKQLHVFKLKTIFFRIKIVIDTPNIL